MNAKYLKTMHSEDKCLCPIIVHNGSLYFCPCCKKEINGINDENKEDVDAWLISAERVIEPKPFLDDEKVSPKEKRAFYELLQSKSNLILSSIDDDTSIESTANILDYKLSNYINIAMPTLLGNIFRENPERYKQIFISSYELNKINRKH